MKLNHINLPVGDVAAARDFLADYFGMRTVFELGRNTMAMMRDDGAMVLNLSHFDKDKTAAITYHRDFHVGFLVETRDEVHASHARLTAGGFAVEAPKAQPGRYGFYLPAPGGFEVEVAVLEMKPRPGTQPDAAAEGAASVPG